MSGDFWGRLGVAVSNFLQCCALQTKLQRVGHYDAALTFDCSFCQMESRHAVWIDYDLIAPVQFRFDREMPLSKNCLPIPRERQLES